MTAYSSCDIFKGMRSNPDNELADVLRAACRESGLSLKKLSDQSGVPYASLHAFMKGQRDIALGTAARLCKVLRLRLVGDKRRAQSKEG